MSWNNICKVSDILPNGGVCALIDGEQVAVFRIQQADNESLFAIQNFDPCSDANVLSRGIVGSVGDKLVVASPIYKEHFELATGQCIEKEDVKLKTWNVQLDGDTVQVQSQDAKAA